MGTKPVQALFATMLAAVLPLTAVAQSATGRWSKDTDCSKSNRPERCQAHLDAQLACQDKRGWEFRQCTREQMKGAAPNAGASGETRRREAK